MLLGVISEFKGIMKVDENSATPHPKNVLDLQTNLETDRILGEIDLGYHPKKRKKKGNDKQIYQQMTHTHAHACVRNI